MNATDLIPRRRHVRGNGVGHEAVVLRCLEHPMPRRIHRLDQPGRGGQGDHRNLLFRRDVDHRHRGGGDGRPDQHVGPALDQLAGVGDGARGVRRVIQDVVFDGGAADLLRQQGDAVALGDAERGRRAGHGQCHTHMHGIRPGSGRSHQHAGQNSGNPRNPDHSSPVGGHGLRSHCRCVQCYEAPRGVSTQAWSPAFVAAGPGSIRCGCATGAPSRSVRDRCRTAWTRSHERTIPRANACARWAARG